MLFNVRNISKLSDEELLTHYIKSGDTEYFGELYNRYIPLTYGLCLKYLQDEDQAQEAVMPYLYCYAGQPWKTQYWVRQIVERLYNSTEKGYPGDEDQGGMSSWYILSSLGIYAVCPGTDEYVIGSPLFKKATITMENGNKFVIEAPENSKENLYIQSATLNGRLLDKNYIHYDDIAEGGVLKFEMGSQPNKERCTSKYAAPFSLSKE